MLNLQDYVKTFDIKLLDGTEIHLRMPSQKLLTRIMKLQNITNDNALEEIGNVLTDILNMNNDGITFDTDFANSLDLSLQMAIIQNYFMEVSNVLGK